MEADPTARDLSVRPGVARPSRGRGARLPAGWLLLLLLWSASADALRAAVRFDVFVGHDSLVPETGWFPVTFEVNNDGPAFTGTVEVSPGNFSSGEVYRLPVELPTGTTKRFVVPVFASGRGAMQWNARLRDERNKVRAETLGVPPRGRVSSRLPFVGALTRSVPVLPDPERPRYDAKIYVGRLQPALFPDNPIALGSLDAIYLSSEKALELRPPQVTALLGWVYGGGHLVVGIEQSGHLQGADWLRRLLPVEIETLKESRGQAALGQWVRAGRIPAARAPQGDDGDAELGPLQLASGRVRDGRVLVGDAAEPLVVAAARGRGEVTVLMFAPELKPFASWSQRGPFWARLFRFPPEYFTAEQFNAYTGQSVDALVGAMIDSRQVRKLPVGWLFLLLLAYLAVIGPFDRWWLARIKRQMLTWITFPIYVALFSGLIYFIGYKLRAGVSECNELHIVDLVPVGGDQADWNGRSYVSIYSPANTQYELASDLPFAALRGEHFGFRGGTDAGGLSVVQRGNNFVARVAVPVWTSQLYVSDWRQRAPAPVAVRIRALGGDRSEVEIENRLKVPLPETQMVWRSRVIDLGAVGAEQTRKFEVSSGSPGRELDVFVQSMASAFQQAANQRQSAFGDADSGRLLARLNNVIGISFASLLNRRADYFLYGSPAGFDLASFSEREEAVVFAWLPDQTLVKSLARFSAARSARTAVLRVVATPVAPGPKS